MNGVTVIVYTMKGCPYCTMFKDMLKENDIVFLDRDIDKYSREYNKFSKITNNDMIPAMMILKENSGDYDSYLYVPDRDFMELEEAITIIKSHLG